MPSRGQIVLEGLKRVHVEVGSVQTHYGIKIVVLGMQIAWLDIGMPIALIVLYIKYPVQKDHFTISHQWCMQIHFQHQGNSKKMIREGFQIEY